MMHQFMLQTSEELLSPGSTLASPSLPSREPTPVWPSPPSSGQSLAPQVMKILCTTGGQFTASPEEAQGRLAYTGGQTRLISLPGDSTFADLLAVIAGKQRSSSSTSAGLSAQQAVPVIRYALPSQPDMAVDVVNTEDVQLMLEEFREQQQVAGASVSRPHLYVEWRQQAQGGPPSSSTRGPASPTLRHRAAVTVTNSQDRRSLVESFSSGDEDSQQPAQRPAGSPPQHKLQVIPTSVVRLLCILGTGTFGDTYKGVWHDFTDVAVKCWGRGAVGLQVENAEAWAEFSKAAGQLAGLRHPNIVQVYGLLLGDDLEAEVSGEETPDTASRGTVAPVGTEAEAPATAAAAAAAAAAADEEAAAERLPAQATEGGEQGSVGGQGYDADMGPFGQQAAQQQQLSPTSPGSEPPPAPPLQPGMEQQQQQQEEDEGGQAGSSSLPVTHRRGSGSGSPTNGVLQAAHSSGEAQQAQQASSPGPPQEQAMVGREAVQGASLAPPAGGLRASSVPQGSTGSEGFAPSIPVHTPALVLEFVSGLSLRNLLERRGGAGGRELSPSSCFIYARDVAKAMEYLHSKGVVHLDLKSGNVLLSWQGPKPQAKVTAWGLLAFKLAAYFSPGMSFRRSWWPWLAPEVFRDPMRISGKADVYSFAIIMWELWAQRKPYEEEGWEQMELLSTSFRLAQVRPALPGTKESLPARPEPAPGWRELMERCWAEDPDARPSFRDILRELHAMGKELKERMRRRRKQQQPSNDPLPDLPEGGPPD